MATLVWFKRDLRIADHPALARAAARGGPVIPLYVAEPLVWSHPDASARQWRFVAESLEALRRDLGGLGAPLVVRHGEALDVLRAIHAERAYDHIESHEETGLLPTWIRDREVAAWCRAEGIRWTEHRDSGVERHLTSRDGWAARREKLMRAPQAPVPEGLQGTNLAPGDVPEAKDLGLGFDPCPGRQKGGRALAEEILATFLHERGEDYRTDMSSPVTGETGCSRLSPHLAWGTMSVREAHQAALARAAETKGSGTGWSNAMQSFKSRLAWRDHFTQKLEDFPLLDERCLHPGFEGMRPEVPDADRLERWAEGMTGLPFVDACMRYAKATGWLNFRMRAMVQCVASYHLWLDWRHTGPVLGRLWTDYAPGIHYAQSQMQSGVTGMNTLRIYNPVKQGHDQDPTGAFTRKWVPELADVPDAHLQAPWEWDGQVKGYPRPVVDVADAARAARDRIYAYRRQPGFRETADAVVARHGSRKGPRTRRPARKRGDPRQAELPL
ncbi:deoxyribodipyrimidine photo-lyase [Jannaschia sp. Os4]|uniref:FAD-binding domain-containing protein n=1 Tax=Jannaschia sp. Os4 TaxID=2807617 RepID=UPI00193A6586|nr:FAD-binding domain-containing protein [Jannaschia sp. Os4]MBM2576962.1 deoxyribodipyrimidine photo-lyase [Jannaschia sp. Os4]